MRGRQQKLQEQIRPTLSVSILAPYPQMHPNLNSPHQDRVILRVLQIILRRTTTQTRGVVKTVLIMLNLRRQAVKVKARAIEIVRRVGVAVDSQILPKTLTKIRKLPQILQVHHPFQCQI